jgi:hypothetical protein
VKSHLTSAVKEEIVHLKSQIEKLNEKCSRLEQENQTLRQYASIDTIALLESAKGLLQNQQINASNNTGNSCLSGTVFSANSTSGNVASNPNINLTMPVTSISTNLSATVSPLLDNQLNTTDDNSQSSTSNEISSQNTSNHAPSSNEYTNQSGFLNSTVNDENTSMKKEDATIQS